MRLHRRTGRRGGGGRRIFSAPETARLRRMTLGALLAVLVQCGVGIAVNLYVTVPTSHPGAEPTNYLSGSASSVAWAVQHGGVSLALHAVLGLLVGLMSLSVIVQAIRVGRGSVTLLVVLAAALVVGAGFNGASFLDYNDQVGSLLMALLAFGACAGYGAALFVLGGSGRGH